MCHDHKNGLNGENWNIPEWQKAIIWTDEYKRWREKRDRELKEKELIEKMKGKTVHEIIQNMIDETNAKADHKYNHLPLEFLNMIIKNHIPYDPKHPWKNFPDKNNVCNATNNSDSIIVDKNSANSGDAFAGKDLKNGDNKDLKNGDGKDSKNGDNKDLKNGDGKDSKDGDDKDPKDGNDKNPEEEDDDDDDFRKPRKPYSDIPEGIYDPGDNDEYIEDSDAKDDEYIIEDSDAKDDEYIKDPDAKDDEYIKDPDAKDDEYIKDPDAKDDEYIKDPDAKDDEYIKDPDAKDDEYYCNQIIDAIIKAKDDEFDNKDYNINMDNYSIFDNLGYVISSRDGIITTDCLFDVTYGELVYFFSEGKLIPGLVLNLEYSTVDIIIFDNDSNILPGDIVIRSLELLSIPVSEKLLGHVIDSLGRPIDNFIVTDINNINSDIIENFEVEAKAPSIISRTSVNKPLETGIKVIDSLVPIGHGQRELIIGDSKTGKTSIAIDSILNQKGTDTICIYVAIGQKRSSVARIVKILHMNECMQYTIIVSATAADSAAAQYIAPYSGCTIGEFFMNKGLNVLIVYDDLSKHAVAYRQLSLLLRRPPGREGYPGDVFYLHSRLLERSANLLIGGSLTALPIIETIQGDVSAYIPTNVISITDGQICLDLELFAKGIRPAVSPGLSVSRVGSAAQCKSLKYLVAPLKLELAQYREVEDFTKLGFVLDDATTALVKRGKILTQLLIQNRYSPINIVKQILFLYSVLNNIIDGIDIKNVSLFEKELYNFFETSFFYEPIAYNLRDTIDSFLLDYILTEFFKYS